MHDQIYLKQVFKIIWYMTFPRPENTDKPNERKKERRKERKKERKRKRKEKKSTTVNKLVHVDTYFLDGSL